MRLIILDIRFLPPAGCFYLFPLFLYFVLSFYLGCLRRATFGRSKVAKTRREKNHPFFSPSLFSSLCKPPYIPIRTAIPLFGKTLSNRFLIFVHAPNAKSCPAARPCFHALPRFLHTCTLAVISAEQRRRAEDVTPYKRNIGSGERM